MGVAARIVEKLQGKCHGPSTAPGGAEKRGRIVIVGSPNVGKSMLFQRLTGAYVTVSNCPGTTVEVFRGKGTLGGEHFEVLDTPGLYSFLPITEEERVPRNVLLNETPDVMLHVVDAKNLERMLPLTLQLLEAGLPVILVLNIIDEAERHGIQYDISLLEKRLGIPVVATSSATGHGIDTLKETILSARRRKTAVSFSMKTRWRRRSATSNACFAAIMRFQGGASQPSSFTKTPRCRQP